MIDVERIFARVPNLDPQDLERWVAMAWVRPAIGDHGYLFEEVDVARITLIRDLTGTMRVGDDALPLVLSLLDQLYDARRRMREIGAALAEVASEELRRDLAKHLADKTPGAVDRHELPDRSQQA